MFITSKAENEKEAIEVVDTTARLDTKWMRKILGGEDFDEELARRYCGAEAGTSIHFGYADREFVLLRDSEYRNAGVIEVYYDGDRVDLIEIDKAEAKLAIKSLYKFVRRQADGEVLP